MPVMDSHSANSSPSIRADGQIAKIPPQKLFVIESLAMPLYTISCYEADDTNPHLFLKLVIVEVYGEGS